MYHGWININVFYSVFLHDMLLQHCRNITDDESSVDELRGTLRFFASVLVRRIHKVR